KKVGAVFPPFSAEGASRARGNPGGTPEALEDSFSTSHRAGSPPGPREHLAGVLLGPLAAASPSAGRETLQSAWPRRAVFRPSVVSNACLFRVRPLPRRRVRHGP